MHFREVLLFSTYPLHCIALNFFSVLAFSLFPFLPLWFF